MAECSGFGRSAAGFLDNSGNVNTSKNHCMVISAREVKKIEKIKVSYGHGSALTPTTFLPTDMRQARLVVGRGSIKDKTNAYLEAIPLTTTNNTWGDLMALGISEIFEDIFWYPGVVGGILILDLVGVKMNFGDEALSIIMSPCYKTGDTRGAPTKYYGALTVYGTVGKGEGRQIDLR